MTWRLGWRTQKEMVWPEGRKPGSCCDVFPSLGTTGAAVA